MDGVEVDNSGSTARDFAMLERNLLSHLKLALLLSLISTSILLRVRLVPETGISNLSGMEIPLASIQLAAALFAIAAGVWEYHTGFKDLMNMRAFLVSTKYHFVIMAFVVAVVVATAIALLADKD